MITGDTKFTCDSKYAGFDKLSNFSDYNIRMHDYLSDYATTYKIGALGYT
jgi:hypothetical protein